MDQQNLDNAIEEANRFLKKCELLKKRTEDKDSQGGYHTGADLLRSGCKETASVKRSSLDLSRSLADLRR